MLVPFLAPSCSRGSINSAQTNCKSAGRRRGFSPASRSPALEETLLGFAKNPEFQLYAPLALHRLNSPRSLQAMAELLSSAPYIPDAARYLAETGDQKWYPVLRDAAVKNGKIVSEPDYAAELGGVKMLPVLVSLEKDPGLPIAGGNGDGLDRFPRSNTNSD